MLHVSAIMTAPPTAIGVESSLDEAMLVMDSEGIRHLPVVRGRELMGIVSDRDLLEVTGWLNRRQREVLESPSGPVGSFMHSPVLTVVPTDSVTKSVLRMASHHIGCLPVVDGGDLVGIVTETDILLAFTKLRKTGRIPDSADAPTADQMNTEVASVSPDTLAEELVGLMKASGLRHLPVLEDGRPVGIVSDRDLRLAIGRGAIEKLEARELMTRAPITIGGEEPVSVAAELMIDGKLGALPVVDGAGRLIGILELSDLFAACLEAFEAVERVD